MPTYLSQEQQRQRFRPSKSERVRRGSGGGQEGVRRGKSARKLACGGDGAHKLSRSPTDTRVQHNSYRKRHLRIRGTPWRPPRAAG
eukprot:5549834-Pyramimonas_sp.AAC.1